MLWVTSKCGPGRAAPSPSTLTASARMVSWIAYRSSRRVGGRAAVFGQFAGPLADGPAVGLRQILGGQGRHHPRMCHRPHYWLLPAVLPSYLGCFPQDHTIGYRRHFLRKTHRISRFIEIVNDDIDVTSVTGARIEPTGNAARPE